MAWPLTAEQEALRDTVRQFAQTELAPTAAARDEAEAFDPALLQPLANLGLLGLPIDPQYGGSGLDMLSIAVVTEELAAADASVALTVAAHNGLCLSHLALAASVAQKKQYLPRLTGGSCLGAWALTESGSGSDAAALTSRAVRAGDGKSWILNGAKMFITNGTLAEIFVILVSTDPAAGSRGITAFLVERGDPGFAVGRKLKKMGMKASDTTELILTDLRLPDSRRIGEIGGAFRDVLQILDKGRISIGALALGIGRAAFDAAVEYAGQRKQFGRELREFQAIQFMLADMATQLTAARGLIERAALDVVAAQAENRSPDRKLCSMAKLFASETASRVCNQALQIHGGYGYTREFPVERFLRDAKLCEIGEGTSEVQRLVIAKQITR